MPSLSDIQIVTVAYNSTDVMGDMLASIPDAVDVVIVDNASTDAAKLADLAATYGARIVTNAQNRGFGAACNIGAAAGDKPWLFFLNPDARMEPNCLETLLAATQEHPDASAYSPRVLDRGGKIAFRRRSRLLGAADHWTGPPPEKDSPVPLLNGAAVFVSRAHFDGINGFDDTIFLYHEDDDLSVRVAAAYGPIYHIHGAAVTHAEGHSTARTPQTAAFKAFHMGQSAVYAVRKHGQAGGAARVRLSALAGLLSPLNLLSARKRAKALGFAKGSFAPPLTAPQKTRP